MTFKEAFEALKIGKKIRRKHWVGFWVLDENKKIKLHCKDGRILGFDTLDDEIFTINNMLEDDWEIVGDVEFDVKIRTYTFGEAIRFLKKGKKVSRKGWNGKGMYLWMKPNFSITPEMCSDPMLKQAVIDNGGTLLGLPTIAMFTQDATGRRAVLTGWLASQSDIFAEDWILVE